MDLSKGGSRLDLEKQRMLGLLVGIRQPRSQFQTGSCVCHAHYDTPINFGQDGGWFVISLALRLAE